MAVEALDRATERWARLLGPPDGPIEEVVAQGVRVAFFRAGGPDVELLEATRPDSAVAKFVARHGPGLHHVAYRVASVDRELEELRRRGERVVDASARPGARGRKVGFAHPTAFGGVLVEFVEGP